MILRFFFSSILAFGFFSISAKSFAERPDAPEVSKGIKKRKASKTEADFCGSKCQKKKQSAKIDGKKTKHRDGPRCKKLEGTLRAQVDAQWDLLHSRGIDSMRRCDRSDYVRVLSELMFKESGCSPKVIHYKFLCKRNRKLVGSNSSGKNCRRHNPTQGVGLFAAEDPRYSSSNRNKVEDRGPACAGLLKNPTSEAEQIRCGVSTIAKHGRAYFGPLKRGTIRLGCS